MKNAPDSQSPLQLWSKPVSPRQAWDQRFRNWLKGVGFNFDPFALLEASTDARLSSYIVGHEAYYSAWGDWPAFIFAPAGGGKTALRAQIAQVCWIGQETNRPFPLPYTIPFLSWSGESVGPEEHLTAISQAGALHLLLTLAHRPHWFFRLSQDERRLVRRVLGLSLSGPLETFLDPCQQTESLEPLRERFAPAFLPPDPPGTATLMRFCETLTGTAPGILRPISGYEQWHNLVDVLCNVLRLPSIYLLLDGLDAAPETSLDPEAGAHYLTPLLDMLSEWNQARFYLKAFLPREVFAALKRQDSFLLSGTQQITLKWPPTLLAEMVRRRVYVASSGIYGSLGPLFSPDVRDVETLLARTVPPLPREMLVLTRQVLFEHVQSDHTGSIQAIEVDRAIQRYLREKPELVHIVPMP